MVVSPFAYRLMALALLVLGVWKAARGQYDVSVWIVLCALGDYNYATLLEKKP